MISYIIGAIIAVLFVLAEHVAFFKKVGGAGGLGSCERKTFKKG